MASDDLALTHVEAAALNASNYPSPPGWNLSSHGPQGAAWHAAITHHYYVELTPEQRMDHRWDNDNVATWDSFFAY
jgi:hypothetical protein